MTRPITTLLLILGFALLLGTSGLLAGNADSSMSCSLAPDSAECPCPDCPWRPEAVEGDMRNLAGRYDDLRSLRQLQRVAIDPIRSFSPEPWATV